MAYRSPFKNYHSQPSTILFPKFKIVCETENHYGYINLRPKEAYQNNAGYAEIDKELFRITGNRVKYIEITDKTGAGRYVYNRPLDAKLKTDADWDTVVSLAANNTQKAIFIFTNAFPPTMANREIKQILGEFAAKYFTDPSGKSLTVCGLEIENGALLRKELLKQPQHRSYKKPQPESQASPIEKLFRDELKKRGIVFKEQVSIERQGAEFTRPDFVIESAMIVIYCDGTEFHKDPQRIIMDKQQDRYLQSLGYTVLRFSGSEIFAHVDGCVNEVTNFIRHRK